MRTLSDYLAALEQRSPSSYMDCTTDRIQQAYLSLGIAPFTATVIKIAGTNGKGSTVSALQRCYSAAGYHVASYTSPHIRHFTERLKIDDQPLPEQSWCRAFSAIEPCIEAHNLTYFESITLAAFYLIQALDVDVILLEIGLGGRHDAVNIIPADHGIITSIGMDHQDILGSTLAEIAWEKAGIIDPHMTVVYPGIIASDVIREYATEQGATYYEWGRDFSWKQQGRDWIFIYQQTTRTFSTPVIHPHVAAGVLMTLQILAPALPIDDAVIQSVWQEIKPIGRCQYIASLATYLDVGHNVDAIAYLMQVVQSQHPNKRVRVVFSCLSNKAIEEMLVIFGELVVQYYIAELQTPRALPLVRIKQAIAKRPYKAFSSITAAYKQACIDRQAHEVIIACGSFHVVEACLPHIEEIMN